MRVNAFVSVAIQTLAVFHDFGFSRLQPVLKHLGINRIHVKDYAAAADTLLPGCPRLLACAEEGCKKRTARIDGIEYPVSQFSRAVAVVAMKYTSAEHKLVLPAFPGPVA